MFPNLEKKLTQFLDLEQQLQDPAVLSAPERTLDILRMYCHLACVTKPLLAFKQLLTAIGDLAHVITEDTSTDFRAYVYSELAELKQQRLKLAAELERLEFAVESIVRDGAIVEIRASSGVNDPATFTGDLFSMYTRYSETRGWKMELLASSPAKRGGFREITASVRGERAYHELRFENGGHRVERVPQVDSLMRSNYSTVTVTVIPEAIASEVDVDKNDCEIVVLAPEDREKREANFRVTHLPTGVAIKANARGAHKALGNALRILRSRLLEARQSADVQDLDATCSTLTDNGAHSECIRIYNYVRNEVIDYRVSHTHYRLDQVMAGDFSDLVNALLDIDHQQRLQGNARF